MSTPEERLLEMLAEQENAQIDEPIQMVGAQGQPTDAGPEGLTPGMSAEEALGVRADIGGLGQPEEVEALLGATGSPAAGAGPIIPEKRANPFAEFRSPEEDRPNPFAPRDERRGRETDFPTPFPMERGTSRASIQLPELASQIGTKHFFPEDMPQWAQLGLTSAIMTTTDPNEIADIFMQEVEYEDPNTGEVRSQRMFPDLGLQQAPDGTLILGNTKTGAQAIINRPGMSAFDIMQMGVIGAAYTPAGRVSAAVAAPARAAAQKAATETARRLAIRQARKSGTKALMAGSAVTESVMQAGQQVAGGEFNAGDVAMATAFGVVPDYVFDPLARTATKIPSILREKAAAVVPENLQQAIAYAKETGRRIMTSDAMAERMTPALNIFTKVVERIPFAGTGRMRKRMARERVDALTDIAAKYGIDVETDYGTNVMKSFVDRMMKRRFWGANEKLIEKGSITRANEMIERAYVAEMDEISHGVLQEAIANNRIDDIVVDRVMDAGRPKQLSELWNKLMPSGKEAARNRFILRGLEESTWTPGAPAIADPKKFMKFLDKPSNRKVIKEWFSPEDQEVLNGVREYLRVTHLAQEAGKGAGMVAAMQAGGGLASFAFGVLNAVAGGAAFMGGAGRIYQSATARNLLLKLAHTKGNEAQTAAIMRELRPYMLAAENQWKGENYAFPDVNITQESLIEGGEDLLMNLEDTAKGAVGDIGSIPDKLLRMLSGDEE